jgi:hypothetical protein
VLIPPPSCCYQESGGVRLLNDHHLLCWPISISPPFFSQLVTDLLGAELAFHARGEIDDCAAKRSDCDRWSPWQPPFENIYLFIPIKYNDSLTCIALQKKKGTANSSTPCKNNSREIRPVAAHHWAAAACYTSPSSGAPAMSPSGCVCVVYCVH